MKAALLKTQEQGVSLHKGSHGTAVLEFKEHARLLKWIDEHVLSIGSEARTSESQQDHSGTDDHARPAKRKRKDDENINSLAASRKVARPGKFGSPLKLYTQQLDTCSAPSATHEDPRAVPSDASVANREGARDWRPSTTRPKHRPVINKETVLPS